MTQQAQPGSAAAPDEEQLRHRAQQIELYGAPLATLVGEVTRGLGVSQAKVASLIGVSAPMLSQLVSARRVKLGNPSAVAQLQQLIELARLVDGGVLTAEEAVTQAAAQETGRVLTRPTATQNVRRGALDVQALLRSVAGAADCLAAADLLQDRHPDLADFLRIYGAGRTDEALDHYRRHVEDPADSRTR